MSRIFLNGINVETGKYLVEPFDDDQAAQMLKGEEPKRRMFSWLRDILDVFTKPHLGLPIDVEPTDIRKAGWAIVFHKDEQVAVKEALTPLIEHRRRQVGDDKRVKVLEYRGSEDADHKLWLARHGVGLGNILPAKVPYYILLVGSPQQIPFIFGQDLDVEYAVGRLHFDDAWSYSQYAASVIEYETGQHVPTAKEVTFWGTRHPDDLATQLSAQSLIKPLADGLPAEEITPIAEQWGFRKRLLLDNAATKEILANVLAPSDSERTPALLFTASHGAGWHTPNDKQKTDQGALICQNWPGTGGVATHQYFAAHDLAASSRVHGLIAFMFACYSAGTPKLDRFIHIPGQSPPLVANEDFIAALPQKLLAHPQGGALACIGHVDRAWGFSIATLKAGPQLVPFQNTLGRLLKGEPIGHATKDFNERYAALSTSLLTKLESMGDQGQCIQEWIERNDAQGYVILGDPAVRLRVEAMS